MSFTLGHRLKMRRDQGNIRFFNQVIDQVLSIPFVVVCLTLAIRYIALLLVQLRIAKVKQTTTNGIDSTWSIT